MPLQILFGEDEHTATDGPYSRLMKTRKWLYITAGASLALQYDLYSEKAFKDVVKLVELPAWVADQATLLALAYLLLQYLLLTLQLSATYDLVVKERLADRRETELAVHNNRIDTARMELKDIEKNLEDEAMLNDEDVPALTPRQLSRHLEKESELHMRRDRAVKFLQELEVARESFLADHSGNRGAYRRAEYAIDAIRILPPILFTIFVLTRRFIGT